jgi:hypothetical protein
MALRDTPRDSNSRARLPFIPPAPPAEVAAQPNPESAHHGHSPRSRRTPCQRWVHLDLRPARRHRASVIGRLAVGRLHGVAPAHPRFGWCFARPPWELHNRSAFAADSNSTREVGQRVDRSARSAYGPHVSHRHPPAAPAAGLAARYDRPATGARRSCGSYAGRSDAEETLPQSSPAPRPRPRAAL